MSLKTDLRALLEQPNEPSIVEGIESGIKYRFRILKLSDQAKIRSWLYPDGKFDQDRFESRDVKTLVTSLVDEDDQPIYTDDDIPALMSVPLDSPVVNLIYRCKIVNKMIEEDQETTMGKSED